MFDKSFHDRTNVLLQEYDLRKFLFYKKIDISLVHEDLQHSFHHLFLYFQTIHEKAWKVLYRGVLFLNRISITGLFQKVYELRVIFHCLGKYFRNLFYLLHR